MVVYKEDTEKRKGKGKKKEEIRIKRNTVGYGNQASRRRGPCAQVKHSVPLLSNVGVHLPGDHSIEKVTESKTFKRLGLCLLHRFNLCRSTWTWTARSTLRRRPRRFSLRGSSQPSLHSLALFFLLNMIAVSANKSQPQNEDQTSHSRPSNWLSFEGCCTYVVFHNSSLMFLFLSVFMGSKSWLSDNVQRHVQYSTAMLATLLADLATSTSIPYTPTPTPTPPL
jgi:hypothetical protein